ncbi:hypothetical protein tb265_00510 [Gemmatimonadetes bacterium T265]|nr:hypothetical protein tb265_00510 [Gemmatimonadetes bacterium T265]
MRRSRAVRLTLAASAPAATVAGATHCAAPGPAPQALHCVERGTNRVVADSLCNASRVASDGVRSGTFGAPAGSSGDFGAASAPDVRSHGTSFVAPFVWYYGGRVAGGIASAGGYVPGAGARYRSSTGFEATGARRGFLGRAFGRSASAPSEGGSGARGVVSRGGFGATGASHGAARGG